MLEKRLLAELNEKARTSLTKRAIFMLSESNADKQVMLNYFLKDSYLRPHRHNRAEQIGTITALIGTFAVIIFSDNGSIDTLQTIENSGIVTIRPNVWHTVLCLTNHGLLFETNGGVYDTHTDKEPAPWAPEEGSAESLEYLNILRSHNHNEKN